MYFVVSQGRFGSRSASLHCLATAGVHLSVIAPVTLLFSFSVSAFMSVLVSVYYCCWCWSMVLKWRHVAFQVFPFSHLFAQLFVFLRVAASKRPHTPSSSPVSKRRLYLCWSAGVLVPLLLAVLFCGTA